MKYLLALIVAVHGLIHLLGFAKAFDLAQVKMLAGAIARPAGVLWLLAALLFLAAAGLLLARSGSWWIPAVPAVVLSQVLVILSWGDAKFGTIANVIVVVVLVPTIAGILPSSFSHSFKQATDEGLRRSVQEALVTEADLAGLPAPVQSYLRYTGSVGKPRITNFHATMSGGMRRSVGAKMLHMTAEQYNFYDQPTRLFLMKASMHGVPFEGLHIYGRAGASMKIRVASLAQIVDAKGSKMDQGETVTMFNDMCILAPGALIDTNIRWEQVDELTARAWFTNRGVTIKAELYFNTAGELVNFISGDRFLSADGKTYASYVWSTPVRNCREFDGRRVATEGEAIWDLPTGKYPYMTFVLEDIAYNVQANRK